MATSPREGLKRNFLIIFIAASLLLIGLIWLENLNASAPKTPGYYRDTYRVDESIYVTATAEAIENERRLKLGTPMPEREEHHGQGQGRGQNQDNH